jgi:hypothetical protein
MWFVSSSKCDTFGNSKKMSARVGKNLSFEVPDPPHGVGVGISDKTACCRLRIGVLRVRECERYNQKVSMLVDRRGEVAFDAIFRRE